MASASIVLSEEQFLCSICLDVFSQPVAIPCGHNFCKACITEYWDSDDCCHCPNCDKAFERRPDLFVNTFISEMASQFRRSAEVKVASSDSSSHQEAKPVEVPCDVCTGTKLKALKSCLVCLVSYCETHLEPHQIVSALKRHKLTHPVENLEDRMCKKHGKLLELFCRRDKVCVCVVCLKTDHKTHDTVPLEETYEERIALLGENKKEVQKMIQERQQKVQQIKHAEELNKKDAEKEIADSVMVFTALVASIQRNQAELIEVIEERQKETEKQGEGLIKELEQEIAELQRRGTELEQLSHTEDHLQLIQSFPSLSTSPPTKDWSEISIHTYLRAETVIRAVAQLEETLDKEMEKLPEVIMKRINLYAVDVTLDPDTAHPELILSEDGKQVRLGDIRKTLPDNPERFDAVECVLGTEGFSSGRFYYEVQVKGNLEWGVGLAKESIDRKGTVPGHQYWAMRVRNGNEYSAGNTPVLPLSLKKKPQKVGVFVDYEGGQISFIDADTKALLYSFSGCNFTEKLYPILYVSWHADGKNNAPLVITSVHKK